MVVVVVVAAVVIVVLVVVALVNEGALALGGSWAAPTETGRSAKATRAGPAGPPAGPAGGERAFFVAATNTTTHT
jgi:hypothetical protein